MTKLRRTRRQELQLRIRSFQAIRTPRRGNLNNSCIHAVGHLAGGNFQRHADTRNELVHTTDNTKHWDCKRTALEDDEKTDSSICPCSGCGQQHIIGTTFCRCGAKHKNLNRRPGKQRSSHTWGRLPQNKGSDSTRDRSSTSVRNVLWLQR